MSDTAEKKSSFSVQVKNLVPLDKLGLPAEDLKIVKETIETKPVKVDLQVIFPANAADVVIKVRERHVKEGAADVNDRFGKLLSKAAQESLAACVKAYQEDQAGGTGGYDKAESLVDKLSKYFEKVMDDYRRELREAIGKRHSLSPKELMTVGSISAKDWRVRRGVFKSETARVTKEDAEDSAELKSAVKHKKWQFLGAAFSTKQGRIALDKMKKFDETRLKELAELYPEDKRNGLKFVAGRFVATSETLFTIEFLEKHLSKLPGNSGDVAGERLTKGIAKQLGKRPSKLNVKVVKTYSDKNSKPDPKDDDAPKDKSKENEKEKEKEKPMEKG